MAALCVQSVEKAACLQAARSLGYNKIKEEQLEVVLSFIAGNDVFVCLPTGFGKSLCFSMLPKVFDLLGAEKSIVIVLTPLTAIIQDQVYYI